MTDSVVVDRGEPGRGARRLEVSRLEAGGPGGVAGAGLGRTNELDRLGGSWRRLPGPPDSETRNPSTKLT